MGTESGGAPDPLKGERSGVERLLFDEPYAFDFFQAVRLLERIRPESRPVGHDSLPRKESVRFRALLSLSFPPSTVNDLEPRIEKPPLMTVAFLGLTGPSGILPRHYTERLMREAREAKGPEKFASRDWFELFNHRLISLFYRAWEKYRFFIPYERQAGKHGELDPFSQMLFSLVGLGMKPLRDRFRVSVRVVRDDEEHRKDLARIEELALLHYSGYLSHYPRSAVALEAMLNDFFQLPMGLIQFQGQWLPLGEESRSRLGGPTNNRLGRDMVVGSRVWDVQSKFRLRIGPVGYVRFREFLPDRAPIPRSKALFLLSQLVRMYVGPGVDFDVQLVLRAEEVPPCVLAGPGADPVRLGWNTWLSCLPFDRDPDDAVFPGQEVVWLDPTTVPA